MGDTVIIYQVSLKKSKTKSICLNNDKYDINIEESDRLQTWSGSRTGISFLPSSTNGLSWSSMFADVRGCERCDSNWASSSCTETQKMRDQKINKFEKWKIKSLQRETMNSSFCCSFDYFYFWDAQVIWNSRNKWHRYTEGADEQQMWECVFMCGISFN